MKKFAFRLNKGREQWTFGTSLRRNLLEDQWFDPYAPPDDPN